MHAFEEARLRLEVATQTGFAALLDVTPQQYRKIIAGRSNVSATMQRLVDPYIEVCRPADWKAHTGDRQRATQPHHC